MAHPGGANNLGDRPLGELMKLLAEQATTLARQEMELAKAEMREKEAQAKPAIMALAVAAVFGVIALSALTTLAIEGLDLVGLPTWLSALVIAILAVILAVVLAQFGKRKLKAAASMPEETVLSLKEDLEWAKLQRISVAR